MELWRSNESEATFKKSCESVCLLSAPKPWVQLSFVTPQDCLVSFWEEKLTSTFLRDKHQILRRPGCPISNYLYSRILITMFVNYCEILRVYSKLQVEGIVTNFREYIWFISEWKCDSTLLFCYLKKKTFIEICTEMLASLIRSLHCI